MNWICIKVHKIKFCSQIYNLSRFFKNINNDTKFTSGWIHPNVYSNKIYVLKHIIYVQYIPTSGKNICQTESYDKHEQKYYSYRNPLFLNDYIVMVIRSLKFTFNWICFLIAIIHFCYCLWFYKFHKFWVIIHMLLRSTVNVYSKLFV